MEWNLSSGAATVIITAMALIWGSIMKIFPKKETSDVVKDFMKSIRDIMTSLKDVTDGQNGLMNKMNMTLTLMQQKVDGSHDKLNLMQDYVSRLQIMEEKIDKIVVSTSKD